MKKLNGALVIEQKHLSEETFLDAINHMEENYKDMRLSLAKNQTYKDASAKLYKLLSTTYQEKNYS